MATGDRNDPYRGFNFKLVIDGITRASFRECSGLHATTHTAGDRQGNEKDNILPKLAGLNKHSNITLKTGVTDDHSLWEWRKTVIDGRTQRKSGSIVLLDETGDEKLRWNFVSGWVTKWTGPSFNATSNDVSIDTLEIEHAGLATES